MPDGPLRVLDRAGQIEIFLHGDILPGVAESYARELKAARNRAVLVRLHSGGGDWLEASAMYAATQAHPGRTVALVEGLAASAASFLLQAFNERRVAENALLMVHAPHMTASGRAEDHEAAAAVLKTVRARLASAYARSGQPTAVIDGWLTREAWFDAEEALAAGLVDAIDQPARVAAHLDLSRFSNVPPQLAAMGRGLPAQSSTEEKLMDTVTTERPEDVAPAQAIAAAVAAERRRSADIRRECREFNAPDLADAYIDGGTDLADVRADLLKRFTAEAAKYKTGLIPSGAGIGFSFDDPRKVCSRMAGALYSRMTGKDPEPESREYRGMSIIAMAKETLEAAGTRTRFLSDSEVVDRILNTGLHTTSDFPALLTESGNRALLASYDTAASAFKTVARRSDAPDFRPLSRIRFGNFPALLEVGEGGEVTYGSSTEAKETYSVKTYARSFALSRQALVNDDLSALSDFTRLAGRAAAEAEASVFVALLALNSGNGPTLSDGVALFNTASHGNLASAGAVISTTTLTAARQALRLMKGLDGSTPVGGDPRYLLVGPVAETAGQQAIAALYPAQSSNVNPFAGTLSLLVEPRLGTSTAWYLFTDPNSVPVLEFAYLQGATGPRLKAMEQADVLGVVFQVVHDFGAGAVDHRGAYRNPGA